MEKAAREEAGRRAGKEAKQTDGEDEEKNREIKIKNGK